MKLKAMGDPEWSRDNNYYIITIFLLDVHQDIHSGGTSGTERK